MAYTWKRVVVIPAVLILLGGFEVGLAQTVSAGKSEQSSRSEPVWELSLKQALVMAEDQNFSIRKAERQIDISRAQYRKTNATFLPSLSVEERAVSTNDPLQAFGIKLLQEDVTPVDFNPQTLNDPDRIENFNTRFQIRQPVFNLDQYFQRSALGNRVEGSKEQWRRTRYGVRYQIKEVYYGMVLQQSRMDVIDTALAAARAHMKQAEDYYVQGMISKASLLSAKVRVNNLEVKKLQAQNSRSDQQDMLRYLLGMEEEQRLEPTDTLRLQPVPEIPQSYESLLLQRSDMVALEYRVEAAKDMLSASRYKFIPSINLFGQYNFHDEVLLGTQGENYLIGASLKWDLFSGFKNIAGIQQSRHELEQARLSYRDQTMKSRTEIRTAARKLEEAREQVRLIRTTIEQAAEDLRIRSDRYEQGMEKTTDLLRAEAQLEEARMKRLQALYQYNVSLARLEFMLEKQL